jgi:hypothetical protein
MSNEKRSDSGVGYQVEESWGSEVVRMTAAEVKINAMGKEVDGLNVMLLLL